MDDNIQATTIQVLEDTLVEQGLDSIAIQKTMERSVMHITIEAKVEEE